MFEDKSFRIMISADELRGRLLKRVEYHQARVKHYLKREQEELKKKVTSQKESIDKTNKEIEDLTLALAQERASFAGYSGISGYSGARGYAGTTGKMSFEATVLGAVSDKAVSHERTARKLQFMADHLKPGVYELTTYELDQLELA